MAPSTRRARRSVLLAALAVVVALCGGARPEPARAATVPTQLAAFAGSGSRRVVVFGDSLSYLSTDEYRTLTAGSYATSFNVMVGTHMASWLPLVPAAALTRPRATVLALGTNDAAGWSAWPGYDPLPYWQQALTALGRQCVVIVHPRDYDAAGTVSQLWARLQPTIATHPNVHVYEGWRDETATVPSLIGPDGVHATALGEQAYAWALFLAQHLCP